MKKLRLTFSVTQIVPTQAMRKAMYKAEVGNEVAGEEPPLTSLF